MRAIFAILALAALALPAAASDTTITYQGQLQDAGGPLTGTPAMKFRLYDSLTEGNQIGQTEIFPAVPVTDGLFQLDLDFDDDFDGERWLEIEVAGEVLEPRQRLTPAPTAVRALNVPEEIVTGLTGGDGIAPATIGDGDTISVAWEDAADLDADGNVTVSFVEGLLGGDGIDPATIGDGDTLSLDTGFTDGLYWRQGGNDGTNPASDFLGTSDQTAFEIHVAGERALRVEPGDVPNLIGGWSGNIVDTDVIGATISGGGCPNLGVSPCDDERPNEVTADFATIGGGILNTASGPRATVGGGRWNTASHFEATVGGGWGNTASGYRATVGGGFGNTASGSFSAVPGGRFNEASGDFSFAAGRRAKAPHDGAFVWADSTLANFVSTGEDQFLVRAGGGVGYVIGDGGWRVEPADVPNLIGGWSGNTLAADVIGATISGGGCPDLGEAPCNFAQPNEVTADFATIGGGLRNIASGARATVGGGSFNTASGAFATVGGGRSNTASGEAATVGGGLFNTASGEAATVGGGLFNTASGMDSTVPGGNNNEALGNYSLAAGRRAKAQHDGAFVWADSTFADFASTGEDQFLIRASGGVGIGTNSPTRMLHLKGDLAQTPTMLFESDEAPEERKVAALFMNVTTGHMSIGRMSDDADSLEDTHFQVRSDNGYVGIGRSGGSIGHPLHMASGAHVTSGGTWTNSSDAEAKMNFEPVAVEEVLNRVSELPLSYWEYKAEPGVRHIGPTAQDFAEAFGVGGDERSISTVDASGAALAAIQGLHAELERERRRNDRLEDRLAVVEADRARLSELAERNTELEDRLAALETLLLADRPIVETRQ